MERPKTPPPTSRPSAKSPLTPDQRKRIEENRLKAKAIRDQREAEQRAAGTAPSVPKTASGLVATDDVYVSKPANGKRPLATAAAADTGTNRDGRDRGDESLLRPAKKFAKFVDYNMSAMTDTKGGFLSAEDDPHNRALGGGASKPGDEQQPQRPKDMTMQEWEKLQLLRTLRRQKAGPFEPGISVLDDKTTRKKCRECGSLEVDWVWEEVFHLCVCNKCKNNLPDKYSLLTKTECKQDYLLTDPELRDPELLPHLSKPNPHKSHWHDMMLFLRCQVEEYALTTKWGSSEALDAEYERRETLKKARKERQFRDKLTDLKRKTRTDAFRRQAGNLSKTGASKFGDAVGGNGKHVHEWGRTIENEHGMTVKTCTACGMEVEELEL
ncbi:hypothetical protein G3M48_000285 [Beauveria asiatica]|uniref:DNA repair protein RAD14 n=1 Tax=Beauveria asiatica TaxID=1069075 RepID=A0AAW0RH98_9HYPO